MIEQPLRIAAAVAMLVVTPLVAAQTPLYKWVDERGVTNYGDAPPTNARKTKALDEAKSSLSVVPGLSKDELARLEARVEQARADRLERENAELRTRLAAAPSSPAPAAPGYDTPPIAYAPVYVPQGVRRPPRELRRDPMQGKPVQRTPPAAGMKLER